MSIVKVSFETDAEAVWFWELAKKLGYKKMEVSFGSDDSLDACICNVGEKRFAKCTIFEANRATNMEKGREIEGRKRNPGRKNRNTKRFVKIYTKKS